MNSRLFYGAVASGGYLVGPLLFSSAAPAQIRIASYNTATAFNTNGNPNAGLQTVLQNIGVETVNGFAKRIDILGLTEQNNATGTSTSQILTMMNNLYGANTYAKSVLIADNSVEPDTDSSAVIYDQTKFTLINETLVGTASGTGPPRQEIRYQFRPVGYAASSDFYMYVVHYKASGSSSDQNRRNIEAGIMRADAAALPVGSRILYTGDFNLTEATTEAAWSTITSTATNPQSAGIDPAGGSWANSNQTWSTTSLGSRLDFQFQTAPTNDAHGFSLINGSYHAFSNNGVAAGGQSPNSSVRSASDHYPIVGDYRYPAKMSVAVGSVPAQVIVGATVGVNVTVTNTAPVQVAIGADGLDYGVSSSGSLSGSANGVNVQALSAGGSHTLTLNTASVGTASGTVSVNSTSQEVANGSFSQAVAVQVLDHSQPSFSGASSVNVATIDFGIKGRNLGGGSGAFSVFSRTGAGATAALDLDSINGSGSILQLITNAAPFANLAAGGSQSFAATILANSNGTLSATYTLNLSDQNLLGAINRGPLTLVLKGIVATPGDTDLNDVIDGSDYARIDANFNNQSTQGDISGWANGDFDGNGKIDGTDYALIDSYFNDQTGTFQRAMSFLDGTDPDRSDMVQPGLRLMLSHFDEFGATYANAFLTSVPEPSLAGVVLGALALSRRRRTRTQSLTRTQ